MPDAPSPEGAEGQRPDRIEIADQGRVRLVRIAHEAKRNALTRPMLRALTDVFRDVGPPDGDGPRALVLTGLEAGRAFSAGFDLTSINDDERARGLDPIEPAARAIETCPVPVVAAIDGPAFGGAVELCVSCQVRIAGAGARFGLPPAKLGLVYSTTGLDRFRRVLPHGQLLRLFLSGEAVEAEEAARIGLVDERVDLALPRALALAEAMAANAPLAVRGTLEAVRVLERRGLAGLTDEERVALEEGRARSLGSADLGEGVAAHLGRRPPVFRGR